MKNRIILMAAAIAAMAVSCQKVELSAPVLKTEPMVISAGVETKTSLVDGKTVNWTSDDVLSVFDNTNTNREFTQVGTPDGNCATFKGVVSEGTETFFAVYPYNSANSAKDGVLTVNLPSNQTPKAGSFAEEHNISVAKGKRPLGNNTTIENNVEFVNACGLLKFTLPTYIPDVTKVTVTSNSNLAGTLSIDYTGETPVVTVASSGSKSVTMEGTYAAGSTFWFVIAPGLVDGITVEVVTDRGAAYSMSTTNKYTVNAGTYKNLGTLKLSEAITCTASAKHVYNEGVLLGTNVNVHLALDQATAMYLKHEDVIKSVSVKVYFDPEDTRNTGDKIVNIIGGWLGQNWGQGDPEPVIIHSNYTTTDIEETITIPYTETYPYLPKDITYIAEVTCTTANGTEQSFTTEFKPETPFSNDVKLSATHNVYTPYTKYLGGDTAGANGLIGSAIYAEIDESNIHPNVLSKNSSLVTITVNIENAVTKSNGYTTINPKKFGENSLTSIVTSFDGSPEHSSTAKAGKYLVTGIPYDYTFKSGTKKTWEGDGWVFTTEDGSGVGESFSATKALVLNYYKPGGWFSSETKNSGYAVSPMFGVPSNASIPIAPIVTVYAYDTMPAFSAYYTGYVGPVQKSTGETSRAASYTIGTESLDVDGAFNGVKPEVTWEDFSISKTYPYIVLDSDNQTTSLTTLALFVYKVRFEYR